MVDATTCELAIPSSLLKHLHDSSQDKIEACIQKHGIDRATEVDDQHMTAFHTLCANLHVTGDAIRSYLQLASEAAVIAQDSEGMTPFQHLCRNDITYLDFHSCLQLASKAGVNAQDSKGMTPFQCFCRNDITFLDDRSFSSVTAWWYSCMP